MDNLNLPEQLMIILIILFLIDVSGILLYIYLTGKKQTRSKSQKMNRDKAGRQKKEYEDLEDFEDPKEEAASTEEQRSVEEEVLIGQSDEDINSLLTDIEESLWKNPQIPVIQVKNVTLEFKVATIQTSGIKELLIMKFKRKNTFRKLKALDQINFTIQRGEIVGIIGTNGSGKSTLLKIISGALKPTLGKVKVDNSKVQLLTLGTGFDMELTGRENIYLNGALIGYSKDYIERHFDEIVSFAELEDFIDEKLRNYSSGMVSRLGFAIATSGKAAEILILDEVLAVGDINFQKKSMKRIQEMIHGGSTVIIVSHSIGVITQHCTRAIWIEKGKLMADGNPKEVCDKYVKMQNNA